MASTTIIESFELKLKTCVREVVGKRKVFSASWQDKEVFVKIFLHPDSAERHWKRDVEGIKKFVDGKVLTPDLLWSGKFPAVKDVCEDNAFGVIVEAVPEAKSLQELWLETDDKTQLTEAIIKVLASHHGAGLIQTDLHFGNFLFSGDKCFSLDGDALHKFEKVPINKAAENYALLMAQAEVINEEHFYSALETYCSLMKFEKAEFKKLIEKYLMSIRKLRCHKLLKKIYRDCSAIKKYSSPGKRAFIQKKYDSQELRKCIDNPESFFPKDKNELLKNGNSASVALVNVDGKKLVIKKYNYSKNFKTFIRRFRKSRASTSWSNAFRLLNYGMKTPEPYALVETYKGPMMTHAYFVAEHIDGDCLLEYINNCQDEMKLKDIFTQVKDIFAVWKKCMIAHGDCKATNFILVDGTVYIIDLDAMQEFNKDDNFKKYHLKDCRRWMKNWEGNQKITDLIKSEFQL
ncbi:MAG: hypothetical protein NE327_15755 [Lentisphaeraceae bacterium]|nr:hypothetical protein [Lentisphaeraceae bacterium]